MISQIFAGRLALGAAPDRKLSERLEFLGEAIPSLP